MRQKIVNQIKKYPKAHRVSQAALKAKRNPKSATKQMITLAQGNPLTLHQRLKTRLGMVNSQADSIESLTPAYHQWIEQNEPSEQDLEDQHKLAKTFNKKPVFSIVTPVFNPPSDILADLIESVLNQSYPYFELCLGEFAGNEESINTIKSYAKVDDRIVLKVFKENGGIAANSNMIAEFAKGDYIALLDHDDLIPPNALYEYAKLINEDEYDFMYSDKDLISEDGVRYSPLFKPLWSPETLYNANYLTHLTVFKKSILNAIGGWSTNTDGAQDWDLFARLLEKSTKVGHIPKILYHWRVIATSTSTSIAAKPWAMEGQKNAVEAYSKANGIKLNAAHDEGGVMHLKLKASSKSDYDLIVIGELGERESDKLMRSANLNNPRKVNLKSADGPRSILQELESSCQKGNTPALLHANVVSNIKPGDIEQLSTWLDIDEVASASGQLYSQSNKLIDAGRIGGFMAAFGSIFSHNNYAPGVFGFTDWIRNVTATSPYFVVYSPELLKQILPNVTASKSDSPLDIHWRISLELRKKNYRHVVTPFVKTYSKKSSIIEPAPSAETQQLLKKVLPHGEDYYFNTNLSYSQPGPVWIKDTNKDGVNNIASAIANYSRGWQNIPQDSENQANISSITTYASDAIALSGQYSFTSKILEANYESIHKNGDALQKIDTAIWLLPNFSTVYAGLKNIFALADQLTKVEGTTHSFVFTGMSDLADERKAVLATFPELSGSKFLSIPRDEIADLPESDVAFCTLWTTAYDLLSYNNTKRKCYIVQDWEPDFYPKGTLSALALQTYDFNYLGICGTEGLEENYLAHNQKNTATSLYSKLELDTYINNSKNKDTPNTATPPYRVMLYARPDMPRNAFELGLNTLTELKNQMGDKVIPILAGSVFDIENYNLQARGIEYAGKVPYDDLPNFYSSFDALLFLMFSQHPGVVPVEMMANGVPAVINTHSSNAWEKFYLHETNCLLSPPVIGTMVESLQRLLTDTSLRTKLITNGYEFSKKFTNEHYTTGAKTVIENIKAGK